MTEESFDFVLSEPVKGVHRIILASTEETKVVEIPEFYERGGDDVRKALTSLISKLKDLLSWVDKVDVPQGKAREEHISSTPCPDTATMEIHTAENGFFIRASAEPLPFATRERIVKTPTGVKQFLSEVIDAWYPSRVGDDEGVELEGE